MGIPLRGIGFAARFASTVLTGAAFALLFVPLFLLVSSMAFAEEVTAEVTDLAESYSSNGVVPLIGVEVSHQKTSAIESSIFTVSPGVVFQLGETSGVSTLSFSHSANTLNTKSIPALKDFTIADTTDYQFEGHAYRGRYTFTAIAQGTSFDDKLSTKSYLDASYVDFSKQFSPYRVMDINFGAGVLYVREGHHIIPFPVVSANITLDNFQATIGFPISYALYTIEDGRQYLSGATTILGSGHVSQITYDYLPTPDIDLSLGYSSENRNQAYGLLNNNTEVSRSSHSISTKVQYKYFYAESSFYFISKLRSYDITTDEKTSFVNYREKPFASITLGAISYTM